jgi:hypothetical protein
MVDPASYPHDPIYRTNGTGSESEGRIVYAGKIQACRSRKDRATRNGRTRPLLKACCSITTITKQPTQRRTSAEHRKPTWLIC